jgi:S-formylglutathione hydrolase FrmB
MKRGVLGVVFFVCLAPGCASSRVPGVSIERIATASLPAPAKVLVLLPPSYARDASRRYPVLYFLHDAWGGARSLESNGVAAELEARMSRGLLPEFLLVAPGAPASWFSDSHDGVRRYEEFLTGDLIAQVEKRYRVKSERNARGITGISMGGYGAFKIALKHPDLYGAVSSLSGALIPIEWDDLARYNAFARWTLKRVFGSSREDNSLADNDVWEILRKLHFDRPPFAAHLRAGAQDVYGLDGVAAQFGAFLAEHGVPASVVLEPGGHDWAYWRRAMLSIAGWHAGNFSYDPN